VLCKGDILTVRISAFNEFFLSSEYDDSNGDGGDDEDGSSSTDTAGNAGGSRSVVGCR
jgi:hypothetical protein